MYFSRGKSQGLIEVAAMLFGLIVAVGLLSLSSARARTRDAKRLADIRMTASALELYANDHSQYPEKFAALSPNYIGQLPTAPLPPDGTCTADNNEYKYVRLSLNDFELSFCLGQPTGNYAAGPHQLSRQGIK